MAQDMSLVCVPTTGRIFSDDELNDYRGQILARALHYIEVVCHCTKKAHQQGQTCCTRRRVGVPCTCGKNGYKEGILRIFDDGTILAGCKGCEEVFIPDAFAKHLSGSNAPNWRKKLWVFDQNSKKIKISDTCLLRYYKGDSYKRPHNETTHRDEFLHCTVCNKLRRFELGTKEEFLLYHQVAAQNNRTCSSMGRWTCEDLEERTCARFQQGCRKNFKCEGCDYCVCIGCDMCRFITCKCQTCIEFYLKA